jgi:hypothetical protein
MPAQRERSRERGGEAAAALSRRLSEAVNAGANGNRPSNGNGPIEVPSKRDVAIDVCRAILAETDVGTAEHSDDVVLITEAIGQRMGFTGADAEDLLAAACLHDIGKAWVPRQILEKPGPLTDEEWALMRRHTVVGQEILGSVPELAQVGRLVRHSHERWDGKGYPDGLMGPEIPLGSRIIFCADAFHAIRSDRPYRAGRSAGEALAEIKRCAGSQFDPTVAMALEDVVHERQRRPRGPGSSRLFALLMCLVVGGAGTALARSDLLSESSLPPSSLPTPPPACGTAGCPTVAAPVGGLAPVGGPGWVPGPRALHPGLHGGIAGGKGAEASPKGNRGRSDQDHGKAQGHSDGSHSSSESSSSHSSPEPSSSSSGGGGSSGGGSHHSSGGHHAGSGHHSGGSRGSSGTSHGNGGGSGGGGSSHGDSGSNAGGSSGSHGK